MKASDTFRLAINSIVKRRLRSWLTVLGIVIGIAAVVSLVSLTQGFTSQIQAQLGGLGGDLVLVTPGGGRAASLPVGPGAFRAPETAGGNLTGNDLQAVRSLPGVLHASSSVSRQASVSFSGKSSTLTVNGVDGQWRFVVTTDLQAGRFLLPGDSRVAVVGNDVANKVFDKPLKLNDLIYVQGQAFRVVGVLKASGVIGQQDRALFIPDAQARSTFLLPQGAFSIITVKASDASKSVELAELIESRLRVLHHVREGEEDFSVVSTQSLQETVNSVIGSANVFYFAIAGISLVVGAIGIANTMFMSVLERTRLIGVMKALGMTNANVSLLFLTESTLLGFFGGALGVLLGVGFSQALPGLISFEGMEQSTLKLAPLVTLELVAFALLFSILIGAVSGILPARRAALLEPVEALRYE